MSHSGAGIAEDCSTAAVSQDQSLCGFTKTSPSVGRGAGIIRDESANETEPLPHHVFYFILLYC